MGNSSKSAPLQRARSRRRAVILGRDAFARISAVEGIAVTPRMQAAFERFDQDGLSAEERRRAIIDWHKPSH